MVECKRQGEPLIYDTNTAARPSPGGRGDAAAPSMVEKARETARARGSGDSSAGVLCVYSACQRATGPVQVYRTRAGLGRRQVNMRREQRFEKKKSRHRCKWRAGGGEGGQGDE